MRKKIRLLAATMLMLLVYSCEKEPMIRFGFDSQFNKDSFGLTIMNVNRNTELVILEGEITVYEGEAQVDLINPEGVKVFSTSIKAPDKVEISKAYLSQSGNWKLKYQSIQGVGTICLHMNRTH